MDGNGKANQRKANAKLAKRKLTEGCWLAGWLVGWLACWLAALLVGLLGGLLAGFLAGWLAGVLLIIFFRVLLDRFGGTAARNAQQHLLRYRKEHSR